MVNVQTISTHTLAIALALTVAATLAGQVRTGGELVKFPGDSGAGVLYATVERGNIKEEIFTSRAAIDAIKNGQPIPSGTVITLVDYRDGELFRYVVMEKRTGWGAEYPPEKRNGAWEYQAFNADKSVNDKKTSIAALPATSPMGSSWLIRVSVCSRSRAHNCRRTLEREPPK